ncbi:MAG: hypothetical protein Kapaf2KO_10800 [Candidatus Kapaibacteriales bacterium]
MEKEKVKQQAKKADQKKLSEKEMKNTKGGGWDMNVGNLGGHNTAG